MVVIDLNITPAYSGVGQSSSGMQRKQPRSILMADLLGVCNLFDKTPIPTTAANDPDNNASMENVIYEGRG